MDPWPQLARDAAIALSANDDHTMTIGTELLADIQQVFEEKRAQVVKSTELIEYLCEDEERPWATLNRGQPISPRWLSSTLTPFDIKSKTIRYGTTTARGFHQSQFDEAFARYLPSTPP